jgi:hypothetical protein
MTEQDLLKLPNVAAFVAGDVDWFDLATDVQDKLYWFYMPMMPYGTAKARTGDPDRWIAERMAKLV